MFWKVASRPMGWSKRLPSGCGLYYCISNETEPSVIFFCTCQSQSQDKTLKLSLNGNRKIVGKLRGYDAFLNVVVEEAVNSEGENIGTIVIRGNSIIQFESIERVVAT